MVLICPQCGDRGFDNAFVYCVKCVKEAVHRYCLDEVPETYDKMNEYVCWVCDDCEAQSQKSIHSDSDAKTQGKTCSEQIKVDPIMTLNKKRISHLTERVENGHCKDGAGLEPPHEELDSSKDPVSHYRPSRDGTNSIDDCSHMVLGEHEPRCPIDSSQLPEAKKIEVETSGSSRRAKVRKLNDFSLLVTTNHSRSAQSVELDEDSPLVSLSPLSTNLKKDLCISLDNSAEQRCENIPTLRPHKEGNDTDHERESDPVVETSLVSCNNNDADIVAEKKCENISTLEPHRECNGTNHERDPNPIPELLSVSSNKNDADNEQRCENLGTLQPHKEGNDNNHEREAEQIVEQSLVRCNKNNADSISQSPMNTRPIVAAGEKLVQAKPLMDPIWRGNFNILNQDDTVEGLAAHLSSKACRMVYNEARMFPTSLQLQILPRAVVWPKSFEKSAPTEDNIAMYIFPMDTRYTSSFDLLVNKMTQQKLAMKGSTENAELLVFTSTELPLSYSKFRDKCYLWGVFRGKPSLASRAK